MIGEDQRHHGRRRSRSRAREATRSTCSCRSRPYYEALTLDETTHSCAASPTRSRSPVMLYDLAHATGVDLAPDVVAGLARDLPNIRT